MRNSFICSRRGNAIIEFAFLAPWLLFVFVGILDYGFYANAMIATQNAARVGAEVNSASLLTVVDTAGPCAYAKAALQYMPNSSSFSAACNALPLIVTSPAVATADGAALTADTAVTVQYQTASLIPIPGILPQQVTITRTVQMKVRQ